MNSETPPIPESGNNNIEPMPSVDDQQDDQLLEELEAEATPLSFTDTWSDTDFVDVTPDIEPAEIGGNESESVDAQGTESPLSEVPKSSELTQIKTFPEDSLADEEKIENSSPDNSSTEPELFADRWLDESDSDLPVVTIPNSENQAIATEDEIVHLEKQKENLHREIEALKAQKEHMLLQQVKEVQESIGRMIEEGTIELKERKTVLQIEIDKLERRKERINQEMRSNFAGSSQELAVRVQGFKNYLVGSLQDLVTAAEKLELARTEVPPNQTRDRGRRRENLRRDHSDRDRDRDKDRDRGRRRERDERGRSRNTPAQAPQAQFSESTFADHSRRIRQLLDKYRNNPDYYGSPWQLRRTFEPIHAKKVQEWFFTQGGRGAVDSMGSRLQNILVASSVISVLHNIYSDRCRVLVLTDTPENLGEWRRGLQDCLGISRSNFGSNRGVVLFDSPDVLVQRAERLITDKLLPLIIIDETEELLNLSVLKFPLWLAFASGNKPTSSNYLY